MFAASALHSIVAVRPADCTSCWRGAGFVEVSARYRRAGVIAHKVRMWRAAVQAAVSTGDRCMAPESSDYPYDKVLWSICRALASACTERGCGLVVAGTACQVRSTCGVFMTGSAWHHCHAIVRASLQVDRLHITRSGAGNGGGRGCGDVRGAAGGRWREQAAVRAAGRRSRATHGESTMCQQCVVGGRATVWLNEVGAGPCGSACSCAWHNHRPEVIGPPSDNSLWGGPPTGCSMALCIQGGPVVYFSSLVDG